MKKDEWMDPPSLLVLAIYKYTLQLAEIRTLCRVTRMVDKLYTFATVSRLVNQLTEKGKSDW